MSFWQYGRIGTSKNTEMFSNIFLQDKNIFTSDRWSLSKKFNYNPPGVQQNSICNVGMLWPAKITKSADSTVVEQAIFYKNDTAQS